MTDPQNSGTMSVSREWLSDLQTFLEEAHDGGIEGLIQEECGNQLFELRAILAQPAPAAQAVDEDAERAAFEKILDALGLAPHEKEFNKAIGRYKYNQDAFEIFSAALAAPVQGEQEPVRAVRLPERREITPGRRENQQDSGFNECLDAVIRLYGLKP